MNKPIKLLKILDDNLLTILLIFFIFFIPLYPKFPFKFIEYTYIAIRLEDLYVVFLTLVFIIQLARRKVTLNTRLLLPILLFWIAVAASLAWGAYVAKTITVINLGFLHAVRRVEYMLVFFIAASTIRSFKTFKTLLWALVISFIMVNLYGLGQRFLGFPAVSTMNPEFARGHILYLTPEARVASTFSGHYDLAMYIVFLIPLVLGFFFSLRHKARVLLLLSVLLSIVILVLTVSRIAFLAYLVSVFLYLAAIRKYTYLVLIMLFSLLIAFTNTDLTKRFKRTVQVKQILVNEKTGQVFVPQKITTKELPLGTAYVPLNTVPKIPKVPLSIKKQPTQTISASASFKKEVATRFVAEEAAKTQKILTATEEARLIASFSALLKPISSIVCDISCATRLQAEWPRALAAFFKNPFLGTGPSSITEATDNDFLRWLGEFGLFGTLAFLYVLISAAYFITKNAGKIHSSFAPLGYAFVFSLFGLLITAIYLDAFEASKVAFVFWYTSGLYYGILSSTPKKRAASSEV